MSQEFTENHDMRVELEGLVQLLAVHLYSDPDVFLRELIQNGHDAVARRQLALQGDGAAAFVPAIRIRVNAGRREISIDDNGAGLNRNEIHRFLSTIGRSGTGELKKQLRATDRRAATELIGQFGIGLLSAFLVADCVVVETRSADGEGLRWTSRGSAAYTLESAPREAIGTTVTLHLGSEHTRYLDVNRLRGIVTRYADLIGMPVYLESEMAPANRVVAPWRAIYSREEDRVRSHTAFWRSRFREEQPLITWPIHLAFTYIDLDQTLREGEAMGVLGVTDHNIPGLATGGSMDVFISGMFVASGSREVLPTWAGFIQGAIECPQLAPNAARDAIMRNDALSALQQALERNILDFLVALHRDRPNRFREILDWHGYEVLGMCIQGQHEAVFQELADVIPLRACDGSCWTMGDLTGMGSEAAVVRYVTDRDCAAQYNLMAQARGWHVIDASRAFVEQFLRRYEATWPCRVQLVALDAQGPEELFRRLPLALEKQLEGILGAARAALAGLSVKIGAFEPSESPAMLDESGSARAGRELDELAADPSLPEYLRNAVRGALEESPGWRTFYLNADCPIVRRLADRPNPYDLAGLASLRALYHHALLLHSPRLGANELRSMAIELQNLISLALDNADCVPVEGERI